MGKAEAPFGKPFKYTETLEFASVPKRRWWQFWIKPKKLPEAWIVNDGYDDHVWASMIPPAELRVSPVEPEAVTPIYDKSFVEDLAIFSQERKDLDA